MKQNTAMTIYSTSKHKCWKRQTGSSLGPQPWVDLKNFTSTIPLVHVWGSGLIASTPAWCIHRHLKKRHLRCTPIQNTWVQQQFVLHFIHSHKDPFTYIHIVYVNIISCVYRCCGKEIQTFGNAKYSLKIPVQNPVGRVLPFSKTCNLSSLERTLDGAISDSRVSNTATVNSY